MASIKFLKHLKQWQVRWHITDPATMQIDKGSKLLPKKSTRFDAEKFAEQIEDRTRQIKTGLAKVNDTVYTAVDKWLVYIQRHADRTQQHYSWVIKRFANALPPSVKFTNQIQPRHIQDYVNSMLATGKKNRTVNSQLTAVKSFCKWCRQYYNLPNPAQAVKMLKEDPPKQRFISETEYSKIFAVDNDLFRSRALFIANTGLRATEFCSLRWSNINYRSITLTGKGRKRRTIPLNRTCLELLDRLKVQDQPNLDDPIFISKSADPANRGKIKPITPNGLELQCLRIAKRAGVPKFGVHALRHYFATQLLLKGVPISLISKLLGHSSIRTTEQIYIHILPEHLEGTTDCLVQ